MNANLYLCSLEANNQPNSEFSFSFTAMDCETKNCLRTANHHIKRQRLQNNAEKINIMPIQGELIRFLKYASGELLPLYISKTTKTYTRVISAIAPEVIDEQTKRVAEEASRQFPPKTAAIAFR